MTEPRRRNYWLDYDAPKAHLCIFDEPSWTCTRVAEVKPGDCLPMNREEFSAMLNNCGLEPSSFWRLEEEMFANCVKEDERG
jgi:hypothetical protein